jgi:hypothetical protein
MKNDGKLRVYDIFARPFVQEEVWGPASCLSRPGHNEN